MANNRQTIDPNLAASIPRDVARRITVAALQRANDPRDGRTRVAAHVRTAVAALEAQMGATKPYVFFAFGTRHFRAVVKDWPLDPGHRAAWPSPRGYTVLSYFAPGTRVLPGVALEQWRPEVTFSRWASAVNSVVYAAPAYNPSTVVPWRTRLRMYLVAGVLSRVRDGYARRATTYPAAPHTEVHAVAQWYARAVFRPRR